MRVRKVAEGQIVLGIQTRAFLECGNGVIIKACPAVLPSIEMCHPVRNVDVDAVYTCARDLSNSFHVDLAPFSGIRTDPDIFVALVNPKGSSTSENRGLSRYFTLQPLRMIFAHRVWGIVSICGNTFSTGDVNESPVASSMRRIRHLTNSS